MDRLDIWTVQDFAKSHALEAEIRDEVSRYFETVVHIFVKEKVAMPFD